MAIFKAFTSLEQSKKLAEILPLESADMYYFLDPTPAGNIYHLVVQRIDFGVRTREPEYDKGDIAVWSLYTLLELIPDKISINNETYYLSFTKKSVEFRGPITWDGQKAISVEMDNILDAAFEMIVKLHDELKLL